MTLVKIALVCSLWLAQFSVAAQENWNDISMDDVVSTDSITRNGFTLVFINKDPAFDSMVKHRMVATFFTVYPAAAALYNSATTAKVIFVIDPGYKGVAAASNGIIRFSPLWFAAHPGDIDVVTHEVMHLVQNYPDNAGPGWLTEGIADYVRYTLGVDNEGAGWYLPNYQSSQNYTDAYRVTARFLAWIEQHHAKGIVKELDAAMRGKTYNDSLWTKRTGKTVEQLWQAYGVAPAL